MSKVLIILMLIVTLSGTGLVVLLIRERDSIAERLLRSGAEQRRLEAEVKALKEERDRLLTQVRPVSAPASSKGPTAVPKGSPQDLRAMQSRKTLAAMLKNPAMRELLLQQQIGDVDAQYEGLFAEFDLDDPELLEFRQLLTERMTLEADQSLKLMEEGLTSSQRAAVTQESQKAKQAIDSRIRNFLNSEEDWAAFKRWEDTKSERMQLDMGRSYFAESGEALTPEQEEQLLDVLRQSRSGLKASPDFSKLGRLDPSLVTEADIERQMSYWDTNAALVLQGAAAFLTPGQMQSLRTVQQLWRSATEEGLRASTRMFQPQVPAVGQ